MADTLIECFTADGSYLLCQDRGERFRLSIGEGPDDLLLDVHDAQLESEEAAELGLKLLRWVASKVHDSERAATVELLLDRAARHIGVGLL